jgi:hypothetical protein
MAVSFNIGAITLRLEELKAELYDGETDAKMMEIN